MDGFQSVSESDTWNFVCVASRRANRAKGDEQKTPHQIQRSTGAKAVYSPSCIRIIFDCLCYVRQKKKGNQLTSLTESPQFFLTKRKIYDCNILYR